MRAAAVVWNSSVWLALTLLAALFVMPAPAAAQGKPIPPGLTALQRGKVSYEERCAVCHGDHGKGDGPAADALRARPTNLATLRKASGSFPAARVEAAIKGTDPVVAHGIPGMMVWGAFFLADANGDQAGADARIRDVVTYIKSLQVQ
jgi:mono/diheme cytochrome c family protein